MMHKMVLRLAPRWRVGMLGVSRGGTCVGLGESRAGVATWYVGLGLCWWALRALWAHTGRGALASRLWPSRCKWVATKRQTEGGIAACVAMQTCGNNISIAQASTG